MGGALSFLHSELGFRDCDSNNHGTHDYCEIVKSTNPQSTTIKELQSTIEVVTIACVHRVNAVETQDFQNCFSDSQRHIIAKRSTHINLFNRTFLI